jgi:hypothetical protein
MLSNIFSNAAIEERLLVISDIVDAEEKDQQLEQLLKDVKALYPDFLDKEKNLFTFNPKISNEQITISWRRLTISIDVFYKAYCCFERKIEHCYDLSYSRNEILNDLKNLHGLACEI